jgi:hypothetical protein
MIAPGSAVALVTASILNEAARKSELRVSGMFPQNRDRGCEPTVAGHLIPVYHTFLCPEPRLPARVCQSLSDATDVYKPHLLPLLAFRSSVRLPRTMRGVAQGERHCLRFAASCQCFSAAPLAQARQGLAVSSAQPQGPPPAVSCLHPRSASRHSGKPAGHAAGRSPTSRVDICLRIC